MAEKLPFKPTKRQIVEAAKSSGWIHAIHRGSDVLKKDNPRLCQVLQDVGLDEQFEHGIAASYARVLGLEIEGGTIPPPSGPGNWEPTEDEQT